MKRGGKTETGEDRKLGVEVKRKRMNMNTNDDEMMFIEAIQSHPSLSKVETSTISPTVTHHVVLVSIGIAFEILEQSIGTFQTATY